MRRGGQGRVIDDTAPAAPGPPVEPDDTAEADRAIEPDQAIERLSMVYDAEGGVAGEVSYVVRHLLGRARCDLCDITHGGVRRKAAFDALLAELPVPAEVLHRNQQPPDLADFTRGGLACVVAHTAAGLELLVDRATLASAGGRVEHLADLLTARLAGRAAPRGRSNDG